MPKLLISSDLTGFFRDEVSVASETLGVQLAELVEFYLVNLLCDFSKRETSPTLGDEPLALIYKKAIEAAPGGQREVHFKELGDISLYVAGFFSESIERSLVDIDYYISMGGNAYGALSELVGKQRRGETFAELYGDLSEAFPLLVDVLGEVRSRSLINPSSDKDLLRLYDRWQRTKSERIGRLLSEAGLVPADTDSTEYIQ